MTKAKDIAAEINKTFGADSVRLGSDSYLTVEYLPTGVLPFDVLTGGLPRGRFTEVFGDYSTLKSYIGLKAVAANQAEGRTCAIIDTEHAFDPEWAASIGVDLKSLILQHPPNGERAMDTAEMLLRRDVDLIVFDSVTAAVPKAEQELMLSGDKNVQPARLASLMSIAMRKLTAANGKTSMLWVNQTRLNVGVMFGNPEQATGGRALPYYASYRVAARKAGRVTDKVVVQASDENGRPTNKTVKRQIKQTIRLSLEKSKLSAPFTEVYFDFDLRTGSVDDLGFLIQLGIERGIVLKEGQSWRLKGSAVKTRGYEAFREKVDEGRLRSLLGIAPTTPGPRRPLRKRADSVKPKR